MAEAKDKRDGLRAAVAAAVDEWMGPEDLAAEFKVPVGTIYQWRSRHYGPKGIRVGRHVRYSRREVNRWTAEQMAASA